MILQTRLQRHRQDKKKNKCFRYILACDIQGRIVEVMKNLNIENWSESINILYSDT